MTSKDSFMRSFEIWWKGIKSLPETTSIHGFRFIADSKRHWTERIFWLVFVVLSWYGSFLLIVAQYDAFQNNPISFVVETTYKDWNTHFPSVAVCENDNTQRIEEVSDKLWGSDHDFNMEEVLKELAYFKGITYYTSEFCSPENPLPECVTDNLIEFANLYKSAISYFNPYYLLFFPAYHEKLSFGTGYIFFKGIIVELLSQADISETIQDIEKHFPVRSRCEDTLTNCSWNGVPFSCCDYFRPMDTDLGRCYTINTIQGREKHPPKLLMVSNQTTGPGMLHFDVLVPANVYVLNEEEVPSLTTMTSDVMAVGSEMSQRRLITIRKIENDPGVRMIAPEKRKCRYTDENSLDVYRHYSYTACTVQCRKNAQLQVCNCTSFFMPNVPNHQRCNISGVICLNDHVNILSVLKAKWSSRAGLYCDCLPSCTEAEITIVKDFKTSTSENFATVEIGLAMLPSERYKRNVVRGFLDLVVSTGGTWGLFLGASLLSFVELFYILLFRPFCDVYSQRNDDPWYRKFGTRKLEDNKFVPNVDWSYKRGKPRKNNLKSAEK